MPASDDHLEKLPVSSRWRGVDSLLTALLIAATLGVFWPVLDLGFHTVDDAEYVAQQPMVNQGFRSAAWVWTFTAPHSANWHPLTTLTHVGVCEFFGLDPRAHHAANLAMHALNAALCFVAFRSLTQRRWESAFIAALFALHPLRVESVAWISELKDLLCATFWFIALWAYAGYVRRRTRTSYALIAFATAAALLSKPMAVTLPLTLLLLDVWPLRRRPRETWKALVWEKGWLLLLVVAQALVTMRVQHAAGAGRFGEAIPIDARMGNALVSVVRYVAKFLWPADLAAFYPHPIHWPWSAVLLCTALLALGTYAIHRLRHVAPWAIMGWLWFLGTLAPVIGLIQVGSQAMADRYTYVPTIGLAVVGVWLIGRASESLRRGRAIVAVVAVAILAMLSHSTREILELWKEPVALFERTLHRTPQPGVLRSYYGDALRGAGRLGDAEDQFRFLTRECPRFSDAWLKLASLLIGSGRLDEAGDVLVGAVAALPDDASAWNNLGVFLTERGRLQEAEDALNRAEILEPADASVQNNLGLLHSKFGATRRAEGHFRNAVRLNEWNPDYYLNLAVTTERNAGWTKARALLKRGLWVNPKHEALARNAAVLFARHGEPYEL